MEVFFVDVGQGSCQIITLGKQRAIVIDAGGTGDVPLTLLKEFLRIDVIELLAISHNDIDHSGGTTRGRPRDKHFKRRGGSNAAGILGHYENAIKEIAVVDDGKFESSLFGKRVNHLLNAKKLSEEQISFLSIRGALPELWWESDDGRIGLELLSPQAGTTLKARSTSDANATSAVFHLKHHNTEVLFTGDSQVDQWRTISRLRANAGAMSAMSVNVATIPHHGGVVGSDLDTAWYYSEAIKAEVSIVSVGSKNQHGHPQKDVIHQLRNAGQRIFCTQIGEGCVDSPELIRPGVIKNGVRFHGQAEQHSTKKNQGRRIACAGTIRVILSEPGYEVENEAKHRAAVDLLQATSGCHPYCR
jgi:hypothetical protein